MTQLQKKLDWGLWVTASRPCFSASPCILILVCCLSTSGSDRFFPQQLWGYLSLELMNPRKWARLCSQVPFLPSVWPCWIIALSQANHWVQGWVSGLEVRKEVGRFQKEKDLQKRGRDIARRKQQRSLTVVIAPSLPLWGSYRTSQEGKTSVNPKP